MVVMAEREKQSKIEIIERTMKVTTTDFSP